MREPHELNFAPYTPTEKLPEGPYPPDKQIREVMLPYWLISRGHACPLGVKSQWPPI